MTVPHLTPAVEASTAPAAFAALRANGLRLSSARRLLLQALYAAERPLSADELAGDGDVASAYRNLEVLEGLGLVRHVHLGHGPGLYQPAVKGASEDLLRAKVLQGTYPPGYTPKRPTKVMQPMPQLPNESPALAAYLR